MNNLGIVRSLDNLGRVTLPKEYRRILDINERDKVEIYSDGQNIIIKKHEENCIICGCNEATNKFKGKIICTKCRKEIVEW